jgi:hypothetical protein
MSDDSWLIEQRQCPLCAKEGKDKSGNNLAVYSDNHEYCYGGHGLIHNGSRLIQFKNRAAPEVVSSRLVLPPDCDVNYPHRAIEWISQYDLDRNDLLSHNVLWSDNASRLIFPVYDAEFGLIAWQGRWFGEGDKPKWFGLGNLKETFNILGNSDILVLTEDVVSAIKVAKAGFMVMPIYGSFIGAKRFERLYKLYKRSVEVVVWLDYDKASTAVKEARTGDAIGLLTRTVVTEQDPKAIPIPLIQEKLTGEPK